MWGPCACPHAVYVIRWNIMTPPKESYGDEDKHKAPTPLHIRPLSLQDAGERFESFPASVVKDHQDENGGFACYN